MELASYRVCLHGGSGDGGGRLYCGVSVTSRRWCPSRIVVRRTLTTRHANWTSSDILLVICLVFAQCTRLFAQCVPLSRFDGMCDAAHGTLCSVEQESGLTRALIDGAA